MNNVALRSALVGLMCIGPAGLAPLTRAQEPAAARAPGVVSKLGVVTKIDPGARQITLKTDTGEVAVGVDAKAKLLRVAPGATNLTGAAAIELTDINPGDRLRARGRGGPDQTTLTALEIVVISQSDIATKQAAERSEWDRRGVTGIVADAGPETITVNVRTLEGIKPLIIHAAPNAIVRRYAPDSVKFSDAKPSTISEVRKGDQVRARGNKTPDGAQMAAEEIVSGQFKMTAGLVASIDAQENVIRITNIETKKPMTIRISADSTLKKLPPQLALLIANRLHGVASGETPRDGAGGPRGGGAGGGPAAVGVGGAASPGGPGGRGPGGSGNGRGGDLQSMIDRTPSIKVSDLMAGEAIIVSSVNGSANDQVTAITLLAGVEPILTKPGSREMSLGDWNMGGGGDLGGFGQ